MEQQSVIAEFDRQTEILDRDDVRRLFQVDASSLKGMISYLREHISDFSLRVDAVIPCCIVIKKTPFPTAELMSRIEVKGANGVVEMTPVAPEDFKPISRVELPNRDAYLLLNVDTGRDSLNVSPESSLVSILDSGRTPLTLEEGVMLTFFYPELLTNKKKYNCIQMPGSRIKDDQRVPSIWLSKGAPRLGWCWDRNPHTWLGSASAEIRVSE